eukprot:105195-Rhodomonas_salina.1
MDGHTFIHSWRRVRVVVAVCTLHHHGGVLEPEARDMTSVPGNVRFSDTFSRGFGGLWKWQLGRGQRMRGPAAGFQVAETGRPRSSPSAIDSIVGARFVSRDHGHESSVDRTSSSSTG